MNKAILNPPVQEFIHENARADVAAVSLAKSPFPDVNSKELAQQIDGRKRCEVKLRLWHNTPGIYYPDKLALEQCSSEETAKYKARLVKGESLIDLTGGFGVDAGFMSTKVNHTIHCELNEELSAISNHNSHVLGFNIEHIHSNGIDYLKESSNPFDTVYIDPSRRVSSRKVFMLKDCEPDVVTEMNPLSDKSQRIIIKTAPLLDISLTIKELGSVSEVHVLSVRNDCKEVVYVIDKGSNETDPPITCALLNKEAVQEFTFRASEEKAFLLGHYSAPRAFLYEPDVALLKAGCFKLITREFKVDKLHQHTHLYTSDLLSKSFPGRTFTVISTREYGDFIKKNSLKKANIICRNFPQDAEKVRKKLRISDGGNDYLLFCTGPKNELLVIHCNRIA
ncbi:THUMP-like domain-containing protein [Daejeonella lutea]|uniref:Uncharacterized protein n=1 Tax=Daejeonella lutea TaxID=572036 RepID=A0A1T5AFB7_9SPHI|nr:hypothetical protein [Daejeonella lutea]SKB33595.1 hypothetical protein SAMN05661099_0659 [Daejeonella lutea]